MTIDAIANDRIDACVRGTDARRRARADRKQSILMTRKPLTAGMKRRNRKSAPFSDLEMGLPNLGASGGSHRHTFTYILAQGEARVEYGGSRGTETAHQRRLAASQTGQETRTTKGSESISARRNGFTGMMEQAGFTLHGLRAPVTSWNDVGIGPRNLSSLHSG